MFYSQYRPWKRFWYFKLMKIHMKTINARISWWQLLVDKTSIAIAIKWMPDQDVTLKILPQEKHEKSLNRMMRYYRWVVLESLSQSMADTLDYTNNYLKARFVMDILKPRKNSEWVIVPWFKDEEMSPELVNTLWPALSTTVFDTAQYTHFIELCRWFSQHKFNSYIPEPNEAPLE